MGGLVVKHIEKKSDLKAAGITKIGAIQIGEIQEINATEEYVKMGYCPVISNIGKGHGFDGIFLTNNGEVKFYESKFIAGGSVTTLKNSANKTINAVKNSRRSEFSDARNILNYIVKTTKNNISIVENLEWNISRECNAGNIRESFNYISDLYDKFNNKIPHDISTEKQILALGTTNGDQHFKNDNHHFIIFYIYHKDKNIIENWFRGDDNE